MNDDNMEKSTPAEDQIASDVIYQNIESILAFYKREEEKLSHPQRLIEVGSNFIGQPYFLGLILLFVALWVLANQLVGAFGWHEFDPAPYVGLQGIVSLCALITTTVVLIKQNSFAKLEEQRAHLELQVNLLTEQKTTKLIKLMEELRHDLPMVKNRYDAEAIALQQPTDANQVLTAIDEWHELDGGD